MNVENEAQAETKTVESIENEIKLLEKETEEYSKQLQDKEYLIDIESFSIFKNILKKIEKDVEWNNNEVAGVIMLYHAMKDQKELPFLQDELKIKLKTATTVTLYKMLLSAKGKGYYEAKEHLQILTAVGKSLSEAVKAIEDDNKKLRDLHQKLTDLDTELTAMKEGIKVSN